MPSHEVKLNAPGLKRRGKRKERLYWAARADIAKSGFTPRLVRLSYNIEDPADHRLIEGMCQRLDAEMKSWSYGKRNAPKHFDGTVLGLSRRYQTDDASPFKTHKWNWRDRETRILKIIEAAFGSRSLSTLGNTDFSRWYDACEEAESRRRCRADRPRGQDHEVVAPDGELRRCRRTPTLRATVRHSEQDALQRSCPPPREA